MHEIFRFFRVIIAIDIKERTGILDIYLREVHDILIIESSNCCDDPTRTSRNPEKHEKVPVWIILCIVCS